ncbi:MAG: VWA domain-containing protein [Planctomycetes bacterium]|nr:VWA domain-containing protein [Planctomycetota bacterium]
MSGLRLHDPLWLVLLVPLFAATVFAVRRQRRTAVLYSSVQLLKSLPCTFALRVKRRLPWVRFAGLALAVAALARPQHGREEFRVRTEGIAIQMCIDRSGSMQALDFELDGKRANRLAVVKKAFRDFVAGSSRALGGGLPGRPDDLIGLIPFGGFAESACPLTLDHGALLQVLDTVKIPEPVEDARGRVLNRELLEEEMATAIGDAVALGVERLKDVSSKTKVIILLSDGESNAGIASPEEGAAAAKAFGIKIYSIGVGTTGRVPFPAVDPFGRQVLVSRPVRIDEKTLSMLAEKTGGRYWNASDTATLEKVYAEIDKLEKTQTEGRLYTEYRELYAHALLPGLALILLELVLSATRFRSLP